MDFNRFMILLRRLIGRSRGGFSVNIRLQIDFDGAPIGLDPTRAKRVPQLIVIVAVLQAVSKLNSDGQKDAPHAKKIASRVGARARLTFARLTHSKGR